MSPKPPYIPLSSSSIGGCPLTERSERIPYPEVPQDQREQGREEEEERVGNYRTWSSMQQFLVWED